jgi:predicted dehydrogenase
MIGTGGIAQRHLGALEAEPDAEVVAHMSPTASHVEAAARRWGGRAYTDHRELLDRERPDAVWVCIPPGAHGAIERDLIERRVPFLVEKPLDADGETAEEIARALAHTNLIAGVAYQWRAMDTVPAVRQTLAENPAAMVLGAWHDATPPPAWWRRQRTSGGQMVEQATHLVDLARHLLGEGTVVAATATRRVRPAYPDADVANVSAALLRFPSDVPGVFTATCLLGGPAAVHVQLVCDGLLVTITRQSVTYERGRSRQEIHVQNDPIRAEDRAFLEAVHTGDPSSLLCSYDDALRTHRLCRAARDLAGAAPES